MLRRLAAWCYRRRRRVVVGWVVALIAISVLGQTVGGGLLKTFSLPGTESDRAFSVLKREFSRKGDTGDLVFKVRGPRDVNSADVRSEIEPVFAKLRTEPHVVSVTSPYEAAGSRFVSRDGKIAYAEILFDVQANDVPLDLASNMRTVAKDANSPRLQVELGGSMFTEQTQPASEAIGILAAAVILLIAFGSFLAMGLPIIAPLFGFGGHTIDRFALPSARRGRSVENSFWTRWSRTLQARPWPAAIGGLVILVVLAVPFFSLRLGVADAGNDPTSLTTRRAYDLLSQGFGPGINRPLLVTSDVRSPADVGAMASLGATIARDPGVAQVSPPITSPNGKGVLLQVIAKGSPQDQSTTELVHRLRDLTVPDASRGSTLNVHVGGQTAVGVDLADTVGQRLPYMFLPILLLSFVLLMLVFRSLLVPLKAVIMNLLSIGAAYGVIVAIFQWGWLKSAVGIGKEGPIEAWVPMMLFAIVFGLSMDYEVFLLSRIKEDYDLTHDNASAVAHGLAKTARLITAAAAIMICVFGSFVLSDLRVLKLIGFGLAFAVFIDASVVRLVLVPATMELLGDRNWWVPKFLEWVPRVHVQGQAV